MIVPRFLNSAAAIVGFATHPYWPLTWHLTCVLVRTLPGITTYWAIPLSGGNIVQSWLDPSFSVLIYIHMIQCFLDQLATDPVV